MILDRYIGRSLVAGSLLALFILVALFSFFTLIEQIEKTGMGNYEVPDAILYVSLSVPKLIYDLFPIATIIGSIAALGMLVNHNEVVAMRMGGISQMRIAISLIKTGVLFVIAHTLIGEFIVPVSEQTAKKQRSTAVHNKISLKTKHGFWSRDGDHYINIREIINSDRLRDIHIYKFDDDNSLTTTIRAKHAIYDNEKWILYDSVKTTISRQQIENHSYQNMEWKITLKPEFIDLVTIKPRHLSIRDLIVYIQHAKKNNLDNKLYMQAFWSKIINPFNIIALILLASCLIKQESRTDGLGKRIFIGILIGILFHFVSEVSGHIGVINNVPAFIHTSLPIGLIFAYIYYRLKKSY